MFYDLSFGFLGHFPDKLGPETRSSGSGLKMVQDAPKISSGDQLKGHVVAIAWSKPTKLKLKMTESFQVNIFVCIYI